MLGMLAAGFTIGTSGGRKRAQSEPHVAGVQFKRRTPAGNGALPSGVTFHWAALIDSTLLLQGSRHVQHL